MSNGAPAHDRIASRRPAARTAPGRPFWAERDRAVAALAAGAVPSGVTLRSQRGRSPSVSSPICMLVRCAVDARGKGLPSPLAIRSPGHHQPSGSRAAQVCAATVETDPRPPPPTSACPARRRPGAAMLTQGLAAPRRVAVRGLQSLVVAGTLLYAGSTLLRTGPSVLLDGWVVPLIGVGAGLLCLARAVLVRQARAAWAILGLGQGLYAFGTIYWWQWVAPLEQPPYPSPADLLWLSFYPLAYAALVLLVRRRVQRLQASMWLDGVVGGLGAAALAAGLVFHTILDATGGGVAAVVVYLTYPVADLLLLMLVMGALAVLGGRPDRALWLL